MRAAPSNVGWMTSLLIYPGLPLKVFQLSTKPTPLAGHYLDSQRLNEHMRLNISSLVGFGRGLEKTVESTSPTQLCSTSVWLSSPPLWIEDVSPFPSVAALLYSLLWDRFPVLFMSSCDLLLGFWPSSCLSVLIPDHLIDCLSGWWMWNQWTTLCVFMVMKEHVSKHNSEPHWCLFNSFWSFVI